MRYGVSGQYWRVPLLAARLDCCWQRGRSPRAVVEDTPSDNSLTRASANSLFQQIQAREAETGGQLGQEGFKLA